MAGTPPSRLRRYAVAILATVAGVLAKEALGPAIVPSAYLTFYPAVLGSALYGGLGSGLLTTALSALIGWYLYLPPIFTPAGIDMTTAVRIALFTAIAALASWAVDRRRMAQERIAESESRLRRMVESDMIGVSSDRSGAILEANDHFLRMVGYTREDLRAGRVRWRDMTPAEFAHLDATAIAQVDATGACVPFEKDFLRQDGSRVPVLVGGAATSDARDKGVFFALDMTEHRRVEDALRLAKTDLETRVTERTAALQEANLRLQQELAERRRIEAALRLSEEHYRQISELTSDYAYRFRIEDDGRMVIEWQAGAFARITGFLPEEIEGVRGIRRLIHPDDLPALGDHMRYLLGGESVTTDFRMRTKSGEYRWLRDQARPEWDQSRKRVVRVLGAARDITERKRAEDERRLSEERFALAVAGANDGVWDWKIETNQVYLSGRWKDILGFDVDEVSDGTDWWVGRVHPGDVAHVVADLNAHLDAVTPHFSSEYRLRHRDGSYRWVLSRGIAVRDPRGKAYRMAGSLTDVTPRRQAEEEARRRQAELAHAQRLSTLGEMAAGLAHELNQPLAAIVSFARGCDRRIRAGDAPPAALLHAIDQVSKQALRAGEILQRYRRFVRPGATRREQVNLNTLTQEVAQFAKPVADDEHIAIRLELAPDIPLVMVDSVQIEQVLVNLVRNGLEAMQGCDRQELWVRTRAQRDAVEVAVEDAGSGIPEEIREHIFEAFFTTKSEGLGMGLSISRSIIDAHGGRLWASSTPGQGTSFCFTVPIAPR